MNVVLINPYELGRQSFNLAHPLAWLRAANCHVQCLDLALEKLDAGVLADAEMVALHLGMHTATRIAVEALPKIRELAPRAHLCAYGLYAPMNSSLLRSLGVESVLGGEFEPDLLALVETLRRGGRKEQAVPLIRLDKIPFRVPQRDALPPLTRYAHLILPDGRRKTVGFAEASRGCKHLCRHCPVVPIYQGKFRVVPADIVMADIRQQVEAGAQHISFGDPDFFNGPTHALRLICQLHQEFPTLSFDATIKIEHLLTYRDLLPQLKETGCLFITTAAESVDDEVLKFLDKGHRGRDLDLAAQLLRQHGIHLAPTFVPFTPWTTLETYIALLQRLLDLDLAMHVAPVQLGIRLLIPAGSHLLHLSALKAILEPFDPALLGYPWRHPDPRVDALQRDVQDMVATAEADDRPRDWIFSQIWERAHAALGRTACSLPAEIPNLPVPRMSEPWYCCAEPTQAQLLNV